jgi:hypothetical protein
VRGLPNRLQESISTLVNRARAGSGDPDGMKKEE